MTESSAAATHHWIMTKDSIEWNIALKIQIYLQIKILSVCVTEVIKY